MGNILHTLLHIIDVEYSWIRAIQKKKDVPIDFTQYKTLHQVQVLSNEYRLEIIEFFHNDAYHNNENLVTASWLEGTFTKDEVLHHIVAHEIHHIGQLSVWARELDLKPVSANVLYRGLFSST